MGEGRGWKKGGGGGGTSEREQRGPDPPPCHHQTVVGGGPTWSELLNASVVVGGVDRQEVFEPWDVRVGVATGGTQHGGSARSLHHLQLWAHVYGGETRGQLVLCRRMWDTWQRSYSTGCRNSWTVWMCLFCLRFDFLFFFPPRLPLANTIANSVVNGPSVQIFISAHLFLMTEDI